MEKHQIITTIFEYNSLSELPNEFASLCEEASNAAIYAYAPYSKFRVGAALLLQNGQIVKGSNQENAAYPSGLCAERVAIFYANANFPDQAVKAIAITAFQNGNMVEFPISPCGSCRQVISETQARYGQPITLILCSKKKVFLIPDANTLLPLLFSKADLG